MSRQEEETRRIQTEARAAARRAMEAEAARLRQIRTAQQAARRGK